MMDPVQEFHRQVSRNIAELASDRELREMSLAWLLRTAKHHYSYNFTWLSRPIIQYPQDIVAIQEVIWKVEPDLIIETGIAHGGSLILSASMLALLDYRDAVLKGSVLDPRQPTRRVIGIDVDIRPHNRQAVENHAMSSRIEMISGSSSAPDVVARVQEAARRFSQVLVILDSDHTHQHVLQELRAYAPLTSIGSYCLVLDTIVEHMPRDMFPDRPWGPGDNPKTAVLQYLKDHPEFEVDTELENKLLVSVAPNGFLRRKF